MIKRSYEEKVLLEEIDNLEKLNKIYEEGLLTAYKHYDDNRY